MTSVSEAVKNTRHVQALMVAQENDVSPDHREKMLEQVTVMQGSIWEYSDSQPWFIAGLHKNNPTATRQALESIMKCHSQNEPRRIPNKRRGTVNLKDGSEIQSLRSSRDQLAPPSFVTGDPAGKGDMLDAISENGDMHTYSKIFCGPSEMKIVIKKTVELVSDMTKSCELVFHAVRAVSRFLTYPTPSVPSDNFLFGHAKGWLWLIHKGLSHFGHDKTDKKDLDVYLKIFRREMSLLAKEANTCISDLHAYMSDLRKLNVAIRKEAKLLKRHNQQWIGPMTNYFRFLDELKTKHQALVDTKEDRFFPSDWIFEPHPSKTKFEWDFFHFQWIDLKRDWIDCEFEIRSDYSLHWTPYSSFNPEQQTEIIVHVIQHLKALIEECHQFHRLNVRLSFDYREIKFLNFAVEEIFKLKKHKDAVEFITCITRKLFEDLALLQKISEEYISSLEWIVTIIEPCYRTLNHWLADDLILPLEFSARIRRHQRWFLNRCCVRGKPDFLEMFGESLNVVLLRSPISISQLEKYFPSSTRLQEEDSLLPCEINSFGISRGYTSSIFDTGLGRDRPLPIHHRLPKYKKHQEQMYNIFDIHRLIEITMGCVVKRIDETLDVDIEKYLVVVEEMQRFWAVFGTIFTSVLGDIKERVEALEALMYNNLPEHYESLDRMIAYEKSKQTESIEKSGSKSFVRLHKIFQFMVYFLEKANALEENDISFYACKMSYYKSYAKVQSWIYQKATIFSMYGLPTKLDMFYSLFSELEKPDADLKVKEFVEQAYKLIDICENILKIQNLG